MVAAVLVVGVAFGFALGAWGTSAGWGSAAATVATPTPAASATGRGASAGAVPAAPGSPAAGPTAGASASAAGAGGPSQSPTAAPYAGPTTRVVPVLMYHSIADPPPGAPYPGLYVSPADFSAQMGALAAAGWRTITAGQLGAAMAAGQPVPVKTIVIMFDDGYRDNFTAALPVLQQYGFVATFSVVAKGGPAMMSPNQLGALVAAGMEVGNHTLDHKNVSRLAGTALWQQIEGGAQQIEARLASVGASEDIRTFVYPSGHYGPAALALLRTLGYTDAFTEQPGFAMIGSTAPLLIPRIRVSRSMTLAEFLARLPQGPGS